MSVSTRFGGSYWTAALFLLLATFWGTSFVAIEVGLHAVPPLYFAGLRYALAGVIVLGYAAAVTSRWRPSGREEWVSISVMAVLVIAVYHGLLYVGELHVSGPVAAVVISLSPVLTAGFATLLLPEDGIDAVGALGLLLGVAGVAVVAGFDPSNLGSGTTVGVLLVLLGGVSFALGGVLTRPLSTDLPVEAGTGWAMALGGLLLLAGSVARGEPVGSVVWTDAALVSFVYLTLISAVVGFLIYFVLMERVGPTQLNLVGYLEPVVAALVAWALFGHGVDATTISGFATIFAGFALVKRRALYDVAVRTTTAVRS